jgi:cell division transport system ATP-binding protein
MPVITFDAATKWYAQQDRPALEGVDLDVEQGDFVFIVGPSGSGKSTLLRMVLKHEQPTAGRVLVRGRDLARMPARTMTALRRRVGCVFQDFRLLPDRTVAGNVRYALDVLGKPPRTAAAVVPEALALVGLAGKQDRYPHELSGGEQQRVALARAFVNRPLLLLADEPTGNLDPESSRQVMRLLERIHRTGTTVLVATHDRPEVDRMRKRVVELRAGRVVRDERAAGYDAA